MKQSDENKLVLPKGRHNYHPGFILFSAVTLVAASAYFTLTHFYLNQNFPLAKLQDLIDGTAYKPFQYRILIPWIVGGLNSLTGAGVLILYQIVESAAVVGVVFSTRYLLRPYFNPPLVDIFSFSVLLLLPWSYLLPREIALVIPADIPAVMFFTLLLGLMYRKKWRWYYVIFAIATINRETTCFVTLIFLLVHWKKLSSKELFLHLLLQLFIWSSVKTWLWILFADNHGQLFEIYNIGSGKSHFATNIEFLTSPKRVLILLSQFGFLWIPILIWRKLIGDQFIVRSLLAFIPFLLVMLIIGNLNEVRIFGEWIPLVLAANLLIVSQLFAKNKQSAKPV